MASTREGQTYIISKDESEWNVTMVDLPHTREREYLSTVALPSLACFLVVHSQSVDLVDSQSQKLLRSFDTDPIQPKTFRCFHSRLRRLDNGSVGVRTLTFAYLNAYTRDLVVQTYSAQYEGDSLCVCGPDPSQNKACLHWQNAKETRRRINDPGVWEALPSRILVGIRRKRLGKSPPLAPQACQQQQPYQANATSLRQRHRRSGAHPALINNDNSISNHGSTNSNCDTSRGDTIYKTPPRGDWEVWMFSQHGKQETWETVPLCGPDGSEDANHLYVTTLGPVARIGRSSLAVGFSNVIKVIVVGQERFERVDEPDAGVPIVGSRRRKGQSYGHGGKAAGSRPTTSYAAAPATPVGVPSTPA